MNFNKSKKVGDIVEEEILKILIKKDPDAFIDDDGKANDKWDIYLPVLEYGIEVKGAHRCNETGNIVVEVRFNGRLSALSKTKSKWWVIVDGYRFIWIKPINIYRFLEINRLKYYQPVPFTGEGDTKEKEAYLVSRDELVSYIYKLDDDEGFIKMIPKSHRLHFDNYNKEYKIVQV